MRNIIKNFLGSFEKWFDALLYQVKKIPWILGKYAFLFILIFILLDMLFGGFLLYRYVLLVKNEAPQISSIPAKFRDDLYQSVLKSWQDREDTLKSASDLNYTSPFK